MATNNHELQSWTKKLWDTVACVVTQVIWAGVKAKLKYELVCQIVELSRTD
jgi:hypothetical protein